MVKSKDSGATETWVQKPALPLTSCVALGVQLNLSDTNLLVYKTREEMTIHNAPHSSWCTVEAQINIFSLK